MFPSFDDFLASRPSLPAETLDALTGEYDVSTPEGLASFTGNLLKVSDQRAVALLRSYHEWLSQHLENQS